MSHVLRVGVADQIAYFRAYNTDGSANTSLTASTTGLTLSVFRIGASSVSIASLSNKAADNTAHADGAIRNVGGNLYTIDIPDAATATQVPSIVVRGSYTGGVIEGLEHPIVAYDPATVAVGANTTTPPTAAANATAVRSELTTELGRIDATISSRASAAQATAIEADTLDIQSRLPATLDSGNMRSSVQSMAPNVLNAAALATDAVQEIQSGLALESTLTVIAGYLDTEITAIKAKTDNLPSDPASASTLAASFVTVNTKLDAIDDYVDSEVAAIKTVTDRLNTMIVLDGSVYQFTANALELGASSGGAVYVLPTKGTQQDRRASTDEIRIYKTEGYTLVRTVEDDAKALVDLSGKTLELVIEGENRNDKAVIPDSDISVSGTGNATYTVEIPTTVSAKSGKTYSFWLWDKTNASRPKMLDSGKFIIDYAGTTGST